MPEDSADLTVALPAYEEAANLDLLLPRLKEVLTNLGINYEIIVVDSETPRDDTAAVCARHSVACKNRAGGELYGDAIRTAQSCAKGRFVVLMDSDGSHDPAILAKLWEQREHADLIIASRYVRGGRTENPAILIFLSLMVNIVFRMVLRLKCADVSNSFRLYHGDEFRSLKLECDNFDVVEEILVKLSCSKPGYKILEVPSTFGQRQAGQTKRRLLVFALGYLGTLMKLHRLKLKATSKG